MSGVLTLFWREGTKIVQQVRRYRDRIEVVRGAVVESQIKLVASEPPVVDNIGIVINFYKTFLIGVQNCGYHLDRDVRRDIFKSRDQFCFSFVADE